MIMLPIDKIETSIQPRYRMDQSIINEYADAMEAGAKFEPVEVVAEKGSERFILIDGHHRVHAAMKIGRVVIATTVHHGGREKAIELALRANATHGLRRSNADKRKVVLMAMNEAVYEDLSLRELADLCQVSHEMVRTIKQEINEKAEDMGDAEQPLDKPPKESRKVTQEEVDLNDLREFIALVKAFPFSGEESLDRLPYTEDDWAGIKHVIEWLSDAVNG